MMIRELIRTRLALGFAVLLAPFVIGAAESNAPAMPVLEQVLTVRASVDTLISMGKAPTGERRVVLITGGTFEGSGMKGTIMPGGEDWQLVRADGVMELDARYWLRTEDGEIIRVHNQVISVPPNKAESGSQPYSRSSVRFEAPIGKYDWLNKAIFVGTIGFERSNGAAVVVLRFFKVS